MIEKRNLTSTPNPRTDLAAAMTHNMKDNAMATTPNETKHYPDFNRCNLVQDQLQLLLAPPAAGSFPFQVSWDDIKKVLLTLLWVALGAVVSYVLEVLIPGLHTTNPYVLLVLPFITSGLQLAQKWLTDTRPADERVRLPYKVYKERVRALKQQLKAGAVVDPHGKPNEPSGKPYVINNHTPRPPERAQDFKKPE